MKVHIVTKSDNSASPIPVHSIEGVYAHEVDAVEHCAKGMAKDPGSAWGLSRHVVKGNGPKWLSWLWTDNPDAPDVKRVTAKDFPHFRYGPR